MAFLERRTSACVPTVWVRFETANRYIEWSESLKDKSQKNRWLAKGFEWAHGSMEFDPMNSLSHEILATAYAAKLNQSGLIGQLRLADSVRIHALRAVELDPENPRALHILGRWHYELSNIGWVTSLFAGMVTEADVASAPQTARRYFESAFRVDPSIQNRYWLGRSLADAGFKSETRALFKGASSTPARTDAEKAMLVDMIAWVRMNP